VRNIAVMELGIPALEASATRSRTFSQASTTGDGFTQDRAAAHTFISAIAFAAAFIFCSINEC